MTPPTPSPTDASPASSTVLASMRGVTRRYRRGGEDLVVLDGLDLDVARGRVPRAHGPVGLGQVDDPQPARRARPARRGHDRGRRDRRSPRSRATSSRPGARATSGFVFQSFNLIPVLTALENVELPLLLTPLGAPRAARARRVRARDRRASRTAWTTGPKQLSGGQEQRVAIARAMATDPTMILADEPTGDLDRASADAVLDILSRLVAENGKTIAMVTHDPAAARARDPHAPPREGRARRGRAPRRRLAVSLFRLVHRNLWRHPIRAFLTFGFAALALFLFVFLRSAITTLDTAARRRRRRTASSSRARRACSSTCRSRTARRSSAVAGRRVDRAPGSGSAATTRTGAQPLRAVRRWTSRRPSPVPRVRDRRGRRRRTCWRTARGASSATSSRDQYGWKVGNRVPILSDDLRARRRTRRGSSTSAASTARRTPNFDNKTMFFHWEYLKEMRNALPREGLRRPSGQDVGVFMTKVKDGYDPDAVIAAIDALLRERRPADLAPRPRPRSRPSSPRCSATSPSFLGLDRRRRCSSRSSSPC